MIFLLLLASNAASKSTVLQKIIDQWCPVHPELSFCPTEKPSCFCGRNFAAVCGTDGITYANQCTAECQKVPIKCHTECPCKEEVNQCKGKPDGTSCTTNCKENENCHTACIDGVCEEVQIWERDYCRGKIDGTSCSKLCRAVGCGPPHTKCKNNACIYSRQLEEENTCKGKVDGASCAMGCRAAWCIPPYTKCKNNVCKYW